MHAMRKAESFIALILLILVLPLMAAGAVVTFVNCGWPVFRRDDGEPESMGFAIADGAMKRTMERYAMVRLPTLLLIVSGRTRLAGGLRSIR